MTTSGAAREWHGCVEHAALLRGEGRFGDDVKPEGALSACFVRSPHAFARIEHIDVTEAQKSPRVVAVFTGADVAQAHYHSLPHGHPIPGRGGRLQFSPHRPVLAVERVMHIGEPVAMVLAESAAAAQDGAEKVVVDYEPLDGVTDAREALKPGAPQLWPEAPGNVGFDWSAPADPDGKKQAALEPRFASASYDAASGRYTLRCPSQAVAVMRGQIVECMKLKPEELHVISEDIGGAFGMKGQSYPEYVALLFATRSLDRPVHWMSGRSEAFVSDTQGRARSGTPSSRSARAVASWLSRSTAWAI